MGLLGLRRYIDTSGCTKLLSWPPRSSSYHRRGGGGDDGSARDDNNDNDDDDGDASPVPAAAHVLVDMNCIIHACFTRADDHDDGSSSGGSRAAPHKSKQQLIHDVLEQLRALLTQIVTPYKTLTLCLDGPAPLAKLPTQRLRRRKVGLMDSASSSGSGACDAHATAATTTTTTTTTPLNALSITAGSLFLVELENALAAQFKLHGGRGFLRQRCAVYLHGSTVAGEGEAKIARALAHIATAQHNDHTHDDTHIDDDGDATHVDIIARRHNNGHCAARRRRRASADSAGSAADGSGGGADDDVNDDSALSRRRQQRHHHRTSSSSRSDNNNTTTTTMMRVSRARHNDNVYRGAYNPNDTIVVFGNDIDLVLTCLGATMYHNLTIVSPQSLQAISVADILYRWVRQSLLARTATALGGTTITTTTTTTTMTSAGSGSSSSSNHDRSHHPDKHHDGGEGVVVHVTSDANAVAAQHVMNALPSLRIDFIFLFLLNGGDHYTGAGEVALMLWTRYRALRASRVHGGGGGASSMSGHYRHHRRLVHHNLAAIDVDFLADVLQAHEYDGDADVTVGLHLLQSALWALYMVVTGQCADYAYVPPSDAPQLSHLRAAVAWCVRRRMTASLQRASPSSSSSSRHGRGRAAMRRGGSSDAKQGCVRLRRVPHSQPLTPLETFVALMPSEAALPVGVAQTLRLPTHRPLATALLHSNDVSIVADAARRVVAAAVPRLTASEQYLRDFTTPVQLNVLPPPPPRRSPTQRAQHTHHHSRLSRYEQHRRCGRRRGCAARLRRQSPVHATATATHTLPQEPAQAHAQQTTTTTTQQGQLRCAYNKSGRRGGARATMSGGAAAVVAVPMVQPLTLRDATGCYLRHRLTPPPYFTYYNFTTPFDAATTTTTTTTTTRRRRGRDDEATRSAHKAATDAAAPRCIYVCNSNNNNNNNKSYDQQQPLRAGQAAMPSTHKGSAATATTATATTNATTNVAVTSLSTRSVTQTVQNALRQLLHATPSRKRRVRVDNMAGDGDDDDDAAADTRRRQRRRVHDDDDDDAGDSDRDAPWSSTYVSNRLQRLQARAEARLLREEEQQSGAAFEVRGKAAKRQLTQQLQQFLGNAHDVMTVLRASGNEAARSRHKNDSPNKNQNNNNNNNNNKRNNNSNNNNNNNNGGSSSDASATKKRQARHETAPRAKQSKTRPSISNRQ